MGNVTAVDTVTTLNTLHRDVANLQERVASLTAGGGGIAPDEAAALRRQVAAVTASADTGGLANQVRALAELTARKADAGEVERVRSESLAASRRLGERVDDVQAGLERTAAAHVADAARLTEAVAGVRGEVQRGSQVQGAAVSEVAGQLTTVLTTLRDITGDVREVQQKHNALHGRVAEALETMALALPHVLTPSGGRSSGVAGGQGSPSLLQPRGAEAAPSIGAAQAALSAGAAVSQTLAAMHSRMNHMEEIARSADTRSADALAAADAALARSSRAEAAAADCISKTKQRLARLTGELTALAPILAAHATSLPAAEVTARTAREEAAMAMADASALATRLGALATAIDSRLANDEAHMEQVKTRLERAEHGTRDLTAAVQALKAAPPPPPPPPPGPQAPDPGVTAALRSLSESHSSLRGEVAALGSRVENAHAAFARLVSATSADLGERPTTVEVAALVRDASRKVPTAVRELLHRVTALEVAQQAAQAHRSSAGSASAAAASAAARVLALRAAAAAQRDEDEDST